MTGRRVLLAGLCALLVVGAAIYLIFGRSSAPQRPAFTLTDLSGHAHAVADYNGNVIVINFWASWCAPCRREIPMLVATQRADGPRGVQVLGIAIDSADNAARFVRRYHVNYPIFAAPDQGARIQDAYTAPQGPIGVLPYTAIVDRKGRIVRRMAGALTRQRLQALIAPLLADKTGQAAENARKQPAG